MRFRITIAGSPKPVQGKAMLVRHVTCEVANAEEATALAESIDAFYRGRNRDLSFEEVIISAVSETEGGAK